MSEIDERVLILTASRRDAESTCDVLAKNQILCVKCSTLPELLSEIQKGCGTVIFAKESLSAAAINVLSEILGRQPPWSYLPTIVLISAGDLALGNKEALNFLRPLRNTTFLERPVRVSTLVSVVQAAIADRKRQYAVRDLLFDLEKAKEQAEHASQTKSAFLANMSHEIRTPLGAILGYTELLKDSNIDASERLDYLEIISRNGKSLIKVIDDILDLSKVEAGRMQIETTDFSIRELLIEVHGLLRDRAKSATIELHSHVDPSVPEEIESDQIRLRQILINILGNAIKFTEKGSVTTTVSTVRNENGVPLLKISVTDTGRGLTAEQVERLFEPFTQADNSTTRKFGGTGLGLALSRRLARALGGDISISNSALNVGSTFVIMVPINTQRRGTHHLRHQSVSAQRHPMNGLAGTRILVVEDSPDNQTLIKLFLSKEGALVELASDGLEGVERAQAESFDLILMDIQMPKMDGYEALTQLKKVGYDRPVIALTAHAMDEERRKTKAAGFAAHLTKPIDTLQLISVVAQHSRK